jgi:Na+/H+ antiporter NhaD/arsenite permease-like protein
MNYRIFIILALIFCLGFGTIPLQAQQPEQATEQVQQDSAQTPPDAQDQTGADVDPQQGAHTEEAHAEEDHGQGHGDHHDPSPFMVIPFIVLLLMIATGPVFFEHFWHKNYKWIAPALGFITLLYYLFVLHNGHEPAHALSEYLSFIALLGPLYVASGGILIQIDREGKPMANLALLIIGSVIANVIGTTGASMLLIRPFIRLNRDRLRPYHIIFFIFMVSNVGGALTPIGDPPLFLGFLRGVPFFWTVGHVVVPWAFALVLLGAVFLWFDRRNREDLDKVETVYSGRVVLRGTKNFLWLAVIVGAVFLDPNVFPWVPAIEWEGTKFSFLREIIQLSAGAGSYYFANKQALRGNEFTFEPILEVVFLFMGIFFAMMPALQLISSFAAAPENANLITEHTLYWSTGILSSFLDNAPTYVNFLSAATAKFQLSVGSPADVKVFALGTQDAITSLYLEAISVAAVFFGAMTYIGNGPNFMVKAIAEERGVKMPSFFAYMIRYSIIILMPILFLTWLIFFGL